MRPKRLLLLVLVCQLYIVQGQLNQSLGYQNISVAEAQALIQDNYLNPDFIILDVRNESEYTTKHLENGVLVNYNWPEFSDILDTLIKDKIYLVHCASGGRSTNACNIMDTKGFQTFYNMTGGINAWVASSYPITTEVAPISLSISDTTLVFNTESFDTDTILVELTNFGNDSIRFSNITDLSSTEFQTNFNIETKVSGLMDYQFEVYYTPIDSENDSIVFEIESDGGNLAYVFKGSMIETSVKEVNLSALKVYPNPCRIEVNLEMPLMEFARVYDMTGKILIDIDLNQANRHVLAVSDLKPGIYHLTVSSKYGLKTKRLVIEQY